MKAARMAALRSFFDRRAPIDLGRCGTADRWIAGSQLPQRRWVSPFRARAAESGIRAPSLRATTECEFDLVQGPISSRARTLDRQIQRKGRSPTNIAARPASSHASNPGRRRAPFHELWIASFALAMTTVSRCGREPVQRNGGRAASIRRPRPFHSLTGKAVASQADR